MKILIVVGIFPPDIGGPATFVPLIAEKLIQKNYKVEVICLSDSLNDQDNNFEFRVHRIGRTGRAGKSGKATAFFVFLIH